MAARCALQALHAAGVPDRKYVKSAKIVAEALRRCPPDDDAPPADGGAAIYGELVRMAQGFSSRYLLVDGQGNFGSVDDEPAADMRYTESRLDHVGAALLADLEGDEAMAAALPTSFPNLLVNGAFGRSPRALTRIAPHNLREIAAAAVAYVEDPAIDVAGLMGHLPGPDFPTGGILLGRDGIVAAYSTGRGRVWLRGRAHFESVPRGRQALVVTQLPYGVMKGGPDGFVMQLAEHIRDEAISGISDVADHSTEEEGMRIVVTLGGDADPTELLHELHAKTPLQTTFLMKLVAAVDGAPRTLTLKDAIALWVEHRRDVIARRGGAGKRSADAVDVIVKDELRAVAARYGDRRRTDIRA